MENPDENNQEGNQSQMNLGQDSENISGNDDNQNEENGSFVSGEEGGEGGEGGGEEDVEGEGEGYGSEEGGSQEDNSQEGNYQQVLLDGEEGEEGAYDSGRRSNAEEGEDQDENKSQNDSRDSSYIAENGEGKVEEDDNEDVSNLPEERGIRYKMFKFLNKMRASQSLPLFFKDLIGDKIAMKYAAYVLEQKENLEEFDKIAKSFNFEKEYAVSSLDSFIDSDKTSAVAKYEDYNSDFYDVQATLIEFQQHAENILNRDFNKVGIGMAFNDTRVVVVNVFSLCEAYVDSCSINPNNGTIVVKGKSIQEKYGVYAMRIINISQPKKTLAEISPQYLSSNFDGTTRTFTGTFNGCLELISDDEPKSVEVYLRIKPEEIRYGNAFNNKIKFDELICGAKVPLETFPLDRQLKEEHRQDEEDDANAKKLVTQAEDFERQKQEEKKRRQNLDTGAYRDEIDLGEIQEEASENENMSENGSEKTPNETQEDKSKNSDLINLENSRERNDNYERELNDLELTIDKLKEENDRIQKKIKVIYEWRKKEGKEERNLYKESNINESTYSDSLSSTAALYNDLNSHKAKLDQDLKRYQASIDEQEKKKQEVYDILMEYKTELLANAETRKNGKIPQSVIDDWLNREKNLEDEIKDLRIHSFTKTLKLNRLKKELKKMEDYFEGLHIIDFEQLKIENNTLTEKIEDRNEEIHKLKNKINYTVQILAHLQEKLQNVSAEKDSQKKEADKKGIKSGELKSSLTKNKEKSEQKTLRQLNENLKIDQINSVPLKNYYRKTLDKIEKLDELITKKSEILKKYRNRRKATVKDVDELIMRRDRMMKDYKTLPKISNDDK